ncbi:MAG: hypothetical protein ACMZ7B_12510 [Balneola sp.]
MIKKLGKKALYILYLLSVSFLILEIIFRVWAFGFDMRGFYLSFGIYPDEIYWSELTSRIDESDYYGFDKSTGWAIKKNGVFRDSLYVSNSMGIRSDKEFSKQKKGSTIRIGLFGDSFIHSDDVYYEESLVHHLEKDFDKKGLDVEVLNFGVSGFGMSQAYLRYHNFGKDYDLDIVVFGFQIENFWRNLNVYRPNYYIYTGLPLVKPRFYPEGDSLKLIKVDDFDIEKLKKLPFNFKQSELAKYEYFTQNDSLSITHNRVLSWSFAYKAFSSLFIDSPKRHKEEIEDSEEGLEVMYFILKKFAGEAQKNGSEFIILELPDDDYMNSFIENGLSPHPSIIDSIANQFTFVETANMLSNYPIDKTYYHHHTDFGNQLISERLVSRLLQLGLVEN